MSNYFKKRMEELGLSDGEATSTKKTTSDTKSNNNTKKSSSDYFSERMKALGLDSSSSKVDSSYIDSFIKDAQSHLDSKNLSGDLFSAHDSWRKKDNELRERQSAIRYYLQNNKDSFTEESYNSMMNFLDDFGKASTQFGYSLYDAERKASINPFDKMTSEDIRKEWEKTNTMSETEYNERINAINANLSELYKNRSIGRAGFNAKVETQIRELETERAKLTKEYKPFSDIAYTTADGKNVTWEQLYNARKGEEEANALYANLSSSDDWKSYVKQGADIVNPTMREAEGIATIFGWKVGGKEVGNIVTYSRDNAAAIAMGDLNDNDMVGDIRYKYMTDNEVEVYNYYLAKYGKEKANEYLQSLDAALTARHNEIFAEGLGEYAKEHPVPASILSVGMNLGTGVEFVKDTITGETSGNSIAEGVSAIRGGVMEGTDWNIGDFDAFDFLYGTGMSMADSAASMVLFGRLGGVNLGLSAAGQSYNDAINRGMSADQALSTAIVAGVAEGLFETISIGKFNALKESGKSGLKNIALDFAKLAVTNASEETLTEIANVAYDVLANGGFSQYETSVRQYINGGLSEEEARKKASGEIVSQIVEAGASGLLMGLGFGGITAMGKTYSNYKTDTKVGRGFLDTSNGVQNNETIDALKSLALEMAGADNTFEGKQLGKFAGKVNSDTHINARQVGKLHRLLGDSVTSQNAADIQTALTENGINKKVATRLAEYIAEGNLAEYAKEVAKLDTADRVRAEDAIANTIGDPLSSVNVRAQRLASAEQGAYSVNDAPKTIEQATPEVLKGDHKVSEEGKTLYVNENGETEEVSISKIVSTEGGIKVALDNGKTVSVKDLELSSDADAMAFEMVTRMEATPETAQVIFEAVKASDATSAKNLFLDVPTAYRYGKINYEAGLAKLHIPNELKKLAFERGRVDATPTESDAKQTAPKVTSYKKGKVVFEGFEYSDDSATDIQKASMAGINLLAKMSSLEFHVYASKVENGKRVAIIDGKKQDAHANGYFMGGTNKIYIDLNAGNKGEGTMLYTLAHEVTHYIADWNWAGFKKLGDFLIKNFGKHDAPVDILIARKKKTLIKSYQRDGKAVPSESQLFKEAYEEVVAEAMSSMFADPKAYEKLAELKKQDKTLWQKLGEAIKKLLDKLKSLLGVYAETKPSAVEAEFVAKFSKDVYDKLQDLYLKAFVEADANYQAAKKDGTADKHLKNRRISYNERAVESHKAKLEEQYSKDASIGLDTLMQRYDKIISIWKSLGGELDSKFLTEWNNKVGKDRAFTVFKAQSGYKYNVELSSMCKKGVPLFEAIDTIVKKEVMKELGTDVLGKEEKEILYDILKSHSFEIPCAICYVEQARQREGAIIDAFLNGKIEQNSKGKTTTFKLGWNEVLKDVEKEMKALGVDYTFQAVDRAIATDKYTPADISMDATTQEAFYNALKKVANKEISRYNKAEGKSRKLVNAVTPAAIKEVFKGTLPSNLKIFKVLFTDPSARFTLESDLLYSSMTTHNLATAHNALYSLFNSQGGVSGYKTKQGTVVYWGDILGKKWTPSKVRDEGGIRNQSNSDFQMYTLLDHAQMYIDFSAKGYYLQAYTKVLAELKLFGLSRGKINASLIPAVYEYRNADGTVDVKTTMAYAGLDQNGDLLFDDIEGINHKEAFMLLEDAEYSKSIGGICIGYSDQHILKLLDDPRVQQIIGFHDKTDDPNKRYRGARYAKNYNGENEAVNQAGETVHIGFNPYVRKAEKMFAFDAKTETYSGEIEYNGKTYVADDIPKLAADLYLEMCEKKGYTPAYEYFADHENYYKLLADFSLYDSQGHYAPHRKVAYNMPDSVPYLDINGKKQYMPTKDYIKAELEKELSVRDAISEALADESENGIIPQFKKRVNEAHEGNVHSERDPYSYESLVSKHDMEIKPLAEVSAEEVATYQADTDLFSKKMREIASEANNKKNTSTATYLYCRDLGADVQVTKDSFKHGAARPDATYIAVCKSISDVLNNSIVVNELTPRDKTKGAYVLLGLTETDDAFVIVRSVVNKKTWKLEDYNELSAIRKSGIKKEDVGVKPPHYIQKNGFGTSSVISIADFLDFVNRQKLGNVVLPLDVVAKLGTERGFDVKLTPNLMYSERSTAPTFYSYMGKVVDGIKSEKVGAGGVVPYLKGKGVKDDEIKWSGIEAWLEGKKSVTKAELQEFVAGSQLQIEEEMSNTATFVDEDGNTYTDSEFKEKAYAMAKEQDIDRDRVKFVLDPDDGSYVAYAGSRFSGIIFEAEADISSGTLGRWSQYKLDGGSNYRELVFKMPNSSYSNKAMRGHWGQDAEGILVHARIQDMTTSDGKNMLFIEELQSDWHNEGLAKGYTTEEYEDAVATYDKLAEDYANKNRAFHKYVRSNEFHSDPDEVSTKKFNWLRRKVEEAEKRMRDAERDVNALKEKGAGDTPDAPFRATYHEYVLKRLLRMAAEEGYDSIGWTPADIQSKRWSEDYAEAYRIEYDQEMPKFLRKYGKKWGATVGTTKVSNDIDVWSMDIPDSMKDSVLNEGQVLYQERDPDSISTRSLLANALESAAKEGEERNTLRNYKTKLRLIEAEQAKLADVRQKAHDLRFKKGRTAEETKALNSLDFEAKQIAKRINSYDRELLKIEAMKPIKDVLNREKQMAYKRAEQKGKEALKKQRERESATYKKLLAEKQEARKKAIEGRHKTEMRHKIKKVVGDLNNLLLNPTKDKHVPIGLQLVVADALDAINMDTMNAAERVAYYNDRIAKSNNPDEIEMLTKKRDFFEYRDANFKDKVTALKNAYAEFKNSDDPLIRNAHNEAIADLIENTSDVVGKKSLKDMSYEQLEAVYNMYKAILATVRNANKMFKEGKQETITENSEAVKTEVREVGGHRDRVLKATKFLKKFGWDMLKPVTAMKVIGSNTLASLFDNVRAGEDTWAVDVSEAKAFYEDVSNKYGYKKWDFKKRYSFKDGAGNGFSLSLEQIMSLYAYSKREQADKHLEFGGFIFDDAIEVTEKTKIGIPMKYEVNDANPYRLRREDLNIVVEALTAEQKGFVDEMQKYLSEVMGEKGNEVSLAMYDIKLYNEKNYFPLKTSRYFREFDPEKSATPKVKNAGFSKKTVPQAGNPIVLSNFMDVWAGHVNDMSMYHAFVLPLEDFTRVYNYSSTAGGYDSVQQYIKNAYGAQANQYVERLLDDLNGGARVDSSAGVINKGLSLFKKASVFASASVVIQQPSAIARAFAYVDPKYFAAATGSALNLANHKELWAEVKKYAPVAIIKEMGYFDTGIGRSSVDWIKGNQNLRDKVDDVLSKAPAIADELAWSHIWAAVKREVKATTNLKEGSEEFLKKAGARFTEVIVNTQVYDSVLSRSGMMRSKDTGMKMATAFMAEPTTTANMMIDGIIQGKRGNKKFLAATVGGVSASIVLNSILVALVYAARDDDEDETYVEKYLGSLTTELLDGFNPLTYIPFVKDIWSIAQGYDVERSDMTVVSNLWESIERMFNENTSGWEKVADVTGAVSSVFGIPLKNIIRDAKGLYNLFATITSGTPTTGAGIADSVEDAFTSSVPLWDRLNDSKTNSDRLYEAIMSGDQVQIDRIKGRFKDEDAVVSAIRKALRENDPRIKEAVMADYNGDPNKRVSLIEEIIAEGYFERKTVQGAVNSAISSVKSKATTAIKAKELGDTDEYNKVVKDLYKEYPKDFIDKVLGETVVDDDDKSKEDKVTSFYSMDEYYSAIAKGNTSLANTAKQDIINTAIANGKSRDEAESSFYSSFRNIAKEVYADGGLSRSEAEKLLVDHGDLDADDAYWKLKEWDYFKENDTTDGYSKYTGFYEAVQTGRNLKAVISEYTSHGVETKTLASQITSYFKPLYKEMSNSERASIKGYLLNAYVQLGYNRADKSKDIDKWLKD